MVLFVTGAAAASDLDTARKDARAGDAAYEAGEFERAVELYSRALDEGLDNADLHYNLGNANYKRGELGHAILGYRRALRLDPRHVEARENLAQAVRLQRDEAFKQLALPLFLRPVQWVYSRISLNEWAMFGLLFCFLLAFVLVAAQWGLLSVTLRQRLVWPALGAILLAFALCGLRYRSEELSGAAVVVAEEVDVRSGPGSDYNLSFRVHEGLTLFISERRSGWFQIHLGGELVGWVPADQVEAI
jgi:tetratricopeptide (TPR) repeat protein